jgi:hypothetical protein
LISKLSRSNRPLNEVSQFDENLVFASLLVLTGSCSLYLLDVRGIPILMCSCSVEVPFVGASCVLDSAQNIVVDISIVYFS